MIIFKSSKNVNYGSNTNDDCNISITNNIKDYNIDNDGIIATCTYEMRE